MELLLYISHHPAMAGRPAGVYQLSYRFGTAPGGRMTAGLLGVINIPVVVGSWNSISVSPVDDIAALWPDMVANDNGVRQVLLGAVSQSGSRAEGYFDFLRFHRDTAGDTPLSVQAEIITAHEDSFPGLTVYAGQEVSFYSDHVNWFGGSQTLYQYKGTSTTGPSFPEFANVASDFIHNAGGLSALNHPLGIQNMPLSLDQQVSVRRRVAIDLLRTRAYHVDIIEAGYRERGRLTLEQHLDLWDTMSRNGVWLTGNGVSDDHSGIVGSWPKLTNRFFTHVFAASTGEADLLAALMAGQVFVGELGSFDGLLDIDVDGCPMGSVSVQPGVDERLLTVTAALLPTDGAVEVVSGPVDYAGPAAPDPGTGVVAILRASDLVGGTAQLQLATTNSSFVRVNVLSAAGLRVAFSNPIWLLREPPPVAIPAQRLAQQAG